MQHRNNAGHVGSFSRSFAGSSLPNGFDHKAGVEVCIPNNGLEPAAASNRAAGDFLSRGAS